MTIANEPGISPTAAVENSLLTSTYRVSDFSTLVFVWQGRSTFSVFRALTHEDPETWYHEDTQRIADKADYELTRHDVRSAISSYIRAYEAEHWTQREDS